MVPWFRLLHWVIQNIRRDQEASNVLICSIRLLSVVRQLRAIARDRQWNWWNRLPVNICRIISVLNGVDCLIRKSRLADRRVWFWHWYSCLYSFSLLRFTKVGASPSLYCFRCRWLRWELIWVLRHVDLKMILISRSVWWCWWDWLPRMPSLS